MSITAARLGSSPLMLDWSNLGNPQKTKAGFSEAWSKLKTRFDSGEVGFYNATHQVDLHHAEHCQTLAQEILKSGQFKDVLFLGIGGSSLGPISLLSALKHRQTTSLKIHFLENPDPTDWKFQISKLNPESTLVVCVTKSGTTFETLALYVLALEWLGKSRWQSHTIAITDPKKGDLKTFAQNHLIRTLDIAPSIGGRFSIFSPVGLFPAALAGLNIKDFLAGAQKIHDYAEKTPVEKNVLFSIGADLISHFQKRPIHVCMPYSTELKSFGAWFTQLWAESLGKDGKGFTPISAMGPVDQHSILQLMRDGPDDKITFFIKVEKSKDEVKIPRIAPNLPAFQILEGHTLHELMQIEYQAISLVMTKQNRPHFTLSIEELNETNIGALYFASCLLTAFTGTLWEVNPFDQPGVEEGKIYIRDALQKSSQEAHQNESNDDNSPVARLRTYANRDRGNSDGNDF